MEQLSNLNQLRNLWLRSSEERIAIWRDFRIELQNSYGSFNNEKDDSALLKCLDHIDTWWNQVPIVRVAIDPYDKANWPTLWEIIDQGECCKYSKGLAKAYAMYYLDQDLDITINRVYDHKTNDEYMLAIFNGKYGLNSPHKSIINVHESDFIEIKDSWKIKDII